MCQWLTSRATGIYCTLGSAVPWMQFWNCVVAWCLLNLEEVNRLDNPTSVHDGSFKILFSLSIHDKVCWKTRSSSLSRDLKFYSSCGLAALAHSLVMVVSHNQLWPHIMSAPTMFFYDCVLSELSF